MGRERRRRRIPLASAIGAPQQRGHGLELQPGVGADRVPGDDLEVEVQRVRDDLSQAANPDVDGGHLSSGRVALGGVDDRARDRKLVHD